MHSNYPKFLNTKFLEPFHKWLVAEDFHVNQEVIERPYDALQLYIFKIL